MTVLDDNTGLPQPLKESNPLEIDTLKTNKEKSSSNFRLRSGVLIFTLVSAFIVFGYAVYEAWKIQTSVSITRVEITPLEDNFHAMIGLNAGSSLKLSTVQISDLQCDVELLDQGSYKHLMSFSSNSRFFLEPNQKVSLDSQNIDMDLLSKTFQSAFVDGIDLREKSAKLKCEYSRQLNLLKVFPVPVGKDYIKTSYEGTSGFKLHGNPGKGKKSHGIAKSRDDVVPGFQEVKGHIKTSASGKNTHGITTNSVDVVSGFQEVVDLDGVRIADGKLLVPINLPFSGLFESFPSSITDFVFHIPNLCEDVQVNVDGRGQSQSDGWALCIEKQDYHLRDVGSVPIVLSVGSLKKQENMPVPLSLLHPLFLVLESVFMGKDLTIVSAVGQVNVLNGFGGLTASKSLTLVESVVSTVGGIESSCYAFSNQLLSLPFEVRICAGAEPGSVVIALGNDDKIFITPSTDFISFSALLPSPDISVQGKVDLSLDASSNARVPETIYLTRFSSPDTVLAELDASSFANVDLNGGAININLAGKMEGGDMTQFTFQANLREFPSIPYSIKVAQGGVAVWELSSSISTGNYLTTLEKAASSLLNNVVSSIVEPFIMEQISMVSSIIGFYVNNVLKPIAWYFGRVENTYEFLVVVGVSNGWHTNFAFWDSYFPVEGILAVPMVASDDVKIELNITRAGFVLPQKNVLETQLALFQNVEERILDLGLTWKDSNSHQFSKLVAELVYQYDLTAVEILREDLTIWLMGEEIFSIDGSAHIRIDLVSPSPTAAPTVAPIKRVLNEWQYCAPYAGYYTFDATRETTDCYVEVCPGDILTASLCNTEASGIWTYGDSYLRLQDPTSWWMEYASSDDSCGLAAKIVSTIGGDACKTVKIVEGCSYYGFCSGRVGVLVTTTESTPTMQPTEFGQNSVLPRKLNEWQTCSSYYRKYNYDYSIGGCLVTLCPGDYFVISQCPSDFNGIESTIGFSSMYLHDPNYYYYTSITRSYLCNPGYSYFGYVPAGECMQYKLDSTCYDTSCSGNEGVYISTSPIGEVAEVEPPVIARSLNTWSSCGAFNLPDSLNSVVSDYCRLEVCPGDVITFSGCPYKVPSSSSTGDVQITATNQEGDTVFSFEYTSCWVDSSNMVLGSECQTLDISLQCNGYYGTYEQYGFQPGCNGNFAVSIDNTGPPKVITAVDEWEVCGSFSLSYGESFLRLCEIPVCQGELVEVSLCGNDNYQFYGYGDASIQLRFENGDSYENPYSPNVDESYFGCKKYLWNNFPAGCSTVGVNIYSTQGASGGTVGVKKSPAPSPTFAPTVHVGRLNYTTNQWQYCDPYSAYNTDSATRYSPECIVRLCPGDRVTATLDSAASQAVCSGPTYLRLYNSYGSIVASNDQSYGGCAHLEYTAGGDSCADYTISEGCWFSSSCSGTVGVYITPPPKPSVLSHNYSVWQYCDFFEASNGASVKCTVPLCPGDSVVATYCSGENGLSICNGDTYLTMYDEYGNFVTYDDDSCAFCSRIQRTMYSIESCGVYTFSQRCYYSWRSCSGQLGIYLTPPRTESPSFRPTDFPTLKPTSPTQKPTQKPTSPTRLPTRDPTRIPTKIPTRDPTDAPTRIPTRIPTRDPTDAPTRLPTKIPTRDPTDAPTRSPTKIPTRDPTDAPTRSPTKIPTRDPTDAPTRNPTKVPTRDPTDAPTRIPTKVPTRIPTKIPTLDPTDAPTRLPTRVPTRDPTDAPTRLPTKIPTRSPTRIPTRDPTDAPTRTPTRVPTRDPTDAPTRVPTNVPTRSPTRIPTRDPTAAPTRTPTRVPTRSPTKIPTKSPSST